MESTTHEICCRLCFCSNGSFLNIFDDSPFALDIAEMLMKYFDDEIKLSDPFPNIICSDCWRKTESFHEFHEKVLSDREKYLNLNYDKWVIKKEQELVLVSQTQCDKFSENINVESIQIDDNSRCLNDGYKPLDLDYTLNGDDELFAIDTSNGSNLDYDCITKTDYKFETNSWSGENDIREDFDENSNDEHFEGDDDVDEIIANEQPDQENTLPTSITQLTESQIHAVVNEYFDMSCDKCKTTFSGFDEAKSHYQYAHNIARGYVKCCNLKLKEHKNYRGHILWHLNPNVFDCSICGSSSKTLHSYHTHKHFHKNRALKRFVCDICDSDFAIKPKLIHHIMHVHAAKKKYFCEECGKSFQTDNQFNVHNRYVHSGLDTQLTPERIEEIIRTKFDMECEVKPCEKVFDSLSDAKQHYLNIHNIPNGWIKCCNNKFKFNKKAKDHIAWHIDPTVFQCPECGKLSNNRNNMNKHMVAHREKNNTRQTNLEDEDLFECEYCNKKFLKKIKLIEHMKFIHEPDIQKAKEAELLLHYFDMTCNKCNNTFKSLQEALTHYIQEHNDQNGYIKCCDLPFSEMALVKDHIKWHLDPNIFKCSQCNEKLKTRKTLQSHMVSVHSQGSFFICDICQKSFKKKEKLKRHILSIHLNYRIQCGLCEEKFENLKRVQVHLESKHINDLNNIETDIKNIQLLDLNDERIKEVMKTCVDQTCSICRVKLDTLSNARIHYQNEHNKPQGYFKCCKTKLRFETTLNDHLNWHVNPKIFRCRLCCKVLGGRSSLISHTRRHQAMLSKRFNCSKCSEIFPRIEKYRTHMETKHGLSIPKRKMYRNKSSPKLIDGSNVEMDEEMEGEEEDDPHWNAENSAIFDMACNDCATVFTSLAHARKHYYIAHKNPNGFLKCCDIKLRTSQDVKDHVAWHKNPECFKCEECGRDYKIKRALLRHNESHTANFQCNRCDKRYTRKTTLHNHMLCHENKEKKLKFVCADCNRSYYSEISLNAHRYRAHTIVERKNSFICEFCALSFRTEGLLKSHARTVHKQGPQKPKQKFKCDICLNFYASKGILRTHKLTHAKEQFKCTLCRKISPTAAALDLHMKAVHVLANFKCHLCEKSFKLAPALKDHIATHLNDKQYKCTYCDEKFIWRTNMYKHRKRIHKKEWEADKAKKEAEKKML